MYTRKKRSVMAAIIAVEEIITITPACDFGISTIIAREEGRQTFEEYWNEVLTHLKKQQQ